jgi:hypothetical protein
MWPQYTLLALYLFGLGVTAGDHGKPRSPESFPRTLFAVSLSIFLLWQGGFFAGMM